MLRSKSSRSAYADLGDKGQKSVFSRTFSASKFCRGDNIGKSVDSHALKSFGRRSIDRNPSKSGRFSEIHTQRALSMQEHMGQLEQELKWAKDRIFVVEEEKKRALNDMEAAKRVANEANMKVNESLSPKKVGELITEIGNLKELLSSSKEELKMKDRDIESLRKEHEKAKQFEVKLREKDSILNKLKEELNRVKASEALAMNQLCSCTQKVEELEDEVHRCKVSEAKMLDSLKSQTKQLEEAKVEAEESKLKIASLNQKVALLDASVQQNEKYFNEPDRKENDYGPAETRSSKPGPNEIGLLRKELRLALKAEEKSKKALDDLASILKEVATESNQAKEKLRVTELDLENVKAEAEQLKQMVRSTEERYEKLLDEAKKEAEMHRNTADRLRLEAEETLLAWNGKEMGFVSCIKRSEEEKAIVQHENNRLRESLKAAEHMTRAAREESYKLRDILKQAINEANAAKAAAGIASDENSQLKDCLVEKDEALHFVTQENERLRISEAAAYENIKEFKRLLSKSSKKFKSQDMLKSPSLIVENHENHDVQKVRKTFSFNLQELNLYNDSVSDKKIEDKDPEKADALKGTIFDSDASPRSEAHVPKPVAHHRRESSVFTDDEETTNSEDLDHLESSNCDDSDSDRNQTKRKTVFRRVGDLIKRKSFQRLVD